MKRLSQHIEYLLHTRRVLTLPGVGSFHIEPRPAFYDKEAGIFYPPAETVEFTAGDFNDDGVLFNSYKRREGLSFNQTHDLVSDDLDALSELLVGGLPFKINGVGSLVSENNELRLVKENEDFSGYRIGLEPLNVSCREREHGQSGESGRKSNREFNPDYYYIPINKRFARVAASFLLVAIVGLFTVLPLRNGTSSTGTASIVPVETKEAVKVMEKVISPVPEPADTTLTKETKDKFFLIIGSFTTSEEAERFMGANDKKGFSLEFIPGKKYCWVSAASAPTKEELLAVRNSDEFRATGLSSWIMERD